MQLKSRHLLLFIIACIILFYSQLSGGALLAIGVLMQMALLIHGLEFSRRSQLGVLKLFLVSIPLFMFWGGIHSFISIYQSENQFLFLIMALTAELTLSFLLCFQVVYSYSYLTPSNFELIATLQTSFNNIKSHRRDFIKITFLLFILSFIPWLNSEWKLVFAIMATHLYLNPPQLKKALSGF